MKFSDEIFPNYSRHHDLLQQAEHVRLARQAQDRPQDLSQDRSSWLSAVRQHLRQHPSRLRQPRQRIKSHRASRSKLPG